MGRRFRIATSCVALVCGPLVLAQDHAHWTYQGPTGATHWAELDKSFSACKLGTHQSPINIDTQRVEHAALVPIRFAYKTEPGEVVNNGHTIQINLPKGSVATIDGVEYRLVQFHFHTPSEEKIDGKNYAMVAHLVHQNAKGQLAVIAVLFNEGKENQALKPIFDNLPPKEGESKNLHAVEPAGLLPANRAYYTYVGSLTTPPCKEEVRWLVLKTPNELSASQLNAFRKLYKMDARPVQALNNRVVQDSQ
ncbi:carbonic anhydrase [Massilia horti]|uniref:carbonic anhydrase n=1 Tax=Massilia horti TaxID=2562153 RepID=A0A4Y9SU23_9BURK|nr:carbonic anhydrase family protein [Massilia horti]TFW30121.1 carbonic anhydrase family protein [Massilia horti]